LEQCKSDFKSWKKGDEPQNIELYALNKTQKMEKKKLMEIEQIERISASNPYKNTLRKLENIRNICKE